MLTTVVDRAASIAAFGQWQYPMLKHPADLDRYRHVIARTQPDVVVECGTRNGASAAWFAERVPMVITVDVLPTGPMMAIDPRSTVLYVTGDSTDPEVARRVAQLVGGLRCMVSLDSDHSAAHVTREIELYAPLVSPGCHLVVEDGVIAWLSPETILAHGCDIYTGTVLEAVETAATVGSLDGFHRDIAVESMSPVTMFPAGWWRRDG